MKKTLDKRFWERVDKTNSSKFYNGVRCWEWMAGKNKDGYGAFADDDGKSVNSHRMSWILVNGSIPLGMSVLHKCDNRSCVNPDHLFLGTQVDNMHDMINKGRGLIGKPGYKPAAKLTESDVLWMRNQPAPVRGNKYKTYIDWANKFGVSFRTILSVINGENWKNVFRS